MNKGTVSWLADRRLIVCAFVQARAVMFTWTLLNGIIDAMSNLQDAVERLCAPHDGQPSVAPGETSAKAAASADEEKAPLQQPSLWARFAMKSAWSVMLFKVRNAAELLC